MSTPRPFRVLLFTDTLGDINGVSRFIRSAAACALAAGKDLRVFTSTNIPVPPAPNITNFPPRLAMRMPGYENLELALPPAITMLRAARALAPDAVHISTPGPVGLVGVICGKLARVPILGTYHTDFPAYIDRLFQNDSLTWLSRGVMRAFYSPFRLLFARSEGYIETVMALGFDRTQCVRLRPGITLAHFDPKFRDEAAMSRWCGSPPGTFRVLYVGRVSVEKNLRMLADIWQKTDALLRARGIAAELVIVGDGPYRKSMQEQLRSTRTVFLGFRHAEELSTCYASCDLFVFPSTTDTLGQVVMEAQSSGLAVLVTDSGGPQEIVREGTTGRVLPAADVGAWVDQIITLAENHNRRNRMGKAARDSMQDYSIRRSFDAFWEVHQQPAGAPLTPPAA